MDYLLWLLVLFAIGFIGSLVSGMVGIGGSIIKYPLLLYLPPALGLAAFTAQEVAAISAVQVFFATLLGVFAYRKDGYLHGPLVLTMGTAMILGSFLGGYGSKFLADSAINLTYALLASAAAILMLLPKNPVEDAEVSLVRFNRTLAAGAAAMIGILAGVVGAAGAFITIPVMLVILRIPTRVAIASSLAITFMSSIGSVSGKLLGGHLLLVPSLVMVVASVLGAPLGVRIGKKTGTNTLRWILAALITATVIKIWFELLSGRAV